MAFVSVFLSSSILMYSGNTKSTYDEFLIESDSIKVRLIINEFKKKSLNFTLENIDKITGRIVIIEGKAKNTDNIKFGSESVDDETTGIGIPVNVFVFKNKIYYLELKFSRIIGKCFISCFTDDEKHPIFKDLLLKRVIYKDTIDRKEKLDKIKKNSLFYKEYKPIKIIGLSGCWGAELHKNDLFSLSCRVWYLTYYQIYFEIESVNKETHYKCQASGFALLQLNGNDYLYRKSDKSIIESTEKIESFISFIEYKTFEKNENFSLNFDAIDAGSLRIISNNIKDKDCGFNTYLPLVTF
jgi:hypothetical protein